MKTEELRHFLIESNKNGYGNEATTIVKEEGGSESIFYENGNWKFHDNWVGSSKFGGREIVYYKNEPAWIMTYYVFPLTDDIQISELYGFLKQALIKMPEDKPFRGPSELTIDDWQYRNEVKGTIESFRGQEEILHKGTKVYEANFIGGLVG